MMHSQSIMIIRSDESMVVDHLRHEKSWEKMVEARKHAVKFVQKKKFGVINEPIGIK